jgi:hypothetical protein
MTSSEEHYRQLNELALQAGRKRLSSQTGYIHYTYQALSEETHYSIPTVENILYVLALLQSKSTENMLEARTRLDKLLFFQNKSDPFQCGNFPIYLHEYPICHDAFVGVHLLPPFYWILKNFGSILGSDLKDKLEKSSILLLQHCLNVLEQKKVTDAIGIKIASSVLAFGTFLQKEESKGNAEEKLEFYRKQLFSPSWFSPTSIANICIGLQMVYPNLSISPWKQFWEHLKNTFYFSSRTYAGPGVKEFQEGEEPQVTLYDLYMGYFSKGFSKRALKDHPCHLQTVLIQPSQDNLNESSIDLSEHNENEWLSWKMDLKHDFAVAHVQKTGEFSSIEKEFHPFKVSWGNEKAHSFISQGGSAQRIDCLQCDDGYELTFHFDTPFTTEEREKSKEIAFYFDYEEGTRITVDTISATTFQLEQSVEWSVEGVEFSLKAAVVNGKGLFFGHIMRGNRPSQLSNQGSQRFNSYDWLIFLRTLSRTDQCQVKVKIHVKKG